MTTIADIRDAQAREAQIRNAEAALPQNGTNHVRDAQGRFVPGHSGNPAGRPKGARNRKTLLAAALAEGEGEAMARVVIDKALAGDAMAARFCLDRLCPKPRGREITLDLPEDLSSGGAVVAAFNAALRAMAAGEITPDEAVTVARFLEGRITALEAWQLERELTRYSDSVPIPGDGAAKEEEEEEGEFPSPLGERLGEGEAPPPERQTMGRGAAPLCPVNLAKWCGGRLFDATARRRI